MGVGVGDGTTSAAVAGRLGSGETAVVPEPVQPTSHAAAAKAPASANARILMVEKPLRVVPTLLKHVYSRRGPSASPRVLGAFLPHLPGRTGRWPAGAATYSSPGRCT